MNTLEEKAFRKTIAQAEELGIEVPLEVLELFTHETSAGGRRWTELHPEDTTPRGCCYGEAINGPEGCTCWESVFAEEQLEPIPGPVECQPSMCADCAYRPGSPEREDAYMEETLLDLPASGEKFFCHAGMRRPIEYVHPDGREVPGSEDDYQPGRLAGRADLVFRADGRPGLLCAGWMAHKKRHEVR